MNVLSKIKSVTDSFGSEFDLLFKLGFMPDKPDRMAGLFEFTLIPPSHTFSGTDVTHNVQLRVRDVSSDAAYKTAEKLNGRLNGYYDDEITVQQSTPVLDLGLDGANPPRHEYTINYIVRRLN